MTTFRKGDRVTVDGAAFGRVVKSGDLLVPVRMEEDHNQHMIPADRLTLVNMMGKPLTHRRIEGIDCDGGPTCPWIADRTHADDGLDHNKYEDES
jgi:hypothetical protein